MYSALEAADLAICVAYLSIPSQILFAVAAFRRSLKVSNLAADHRTLFSILLLLGLFTLFVLLCGFTHMLRFILRETLVRDGPVKYYRVEETLTVVTAGE